MNLAEFAAALALIGPLVSCTNGGATAPKVDAGRPSFCAGDGDIDFGLTGTAPSSWEGRAVVVAAIEDHVKGESSEVRRVPRRVVHTSATIQGGTFSISCPRSLHDKFAYPTYAVFVDLDGDGRCSDGDLAYQELRFGWRNSELNTAPEPSQWQAISAEHPPKWGVYGDFCDGYFGADGPKARTPGL